MSSQFHSLFRRTGVDVLLRTYGEEDVQYMQDGSSPRTVSAMVTREEAAIVQELGDQLACAAIIRVRNDSDNGISISELNTKTDRFSVRLQVGDNQVSDRRIVRVISSANGFLRLALQ
jgi:hypothetical protein